MNHQPDQSWPPVEVSTYDPNNSQRQVRIANVNGPCPAWVACISNDDLTQAVRSHRADLDPIDPNDPKQVYWVDHPGQWRGV